MSAQAIPDTIPTELIERPQWVNGEPGTKIPINAKTGGRADTTDSSTWATITVARKRADRAGLKIGYVFSADDGLHGLDLDHCRDPETGRIEPWARAIVDSYPTYWEVSTSGTGLHGFGRGTLPAGGHKKPMPNGGKIEMYDRGRYFIVTGDHLEGTPGTIQDAQDALNTLHRDTFPPAPPKPPTAPHSPVSMDDSELIERMMKGANGFQVRALWDGSTDGHGGDDSAADLALCNHLMFWTGNDMARTDRLFRQSGLMRDKWDEQRGDRTYGGITLGNAVQSKTYDPNYRPPTGTITPISRNVDADTGEVLNDPRPGIDAGNLSLPDVAAQAWDALIGANDPAYLFRHAGQVVRLELDDEGRLIVRALSPERLRHELARAARWYTIKRSAEVDALPPLHVVQDMLASPEPPLPILTRITETPVFARGGRLVDAPGYDPASGTLYAPAKGLTVPPIPEAPTDDDVARARVMILDDLMGDFPFTGEAERANAAALMILTFARDLIEGSTPLHLFEAPAPGSGKGLLSDACSQPALGALTGTITEGGDEDEWRKRISANLREAAPMILLDNISRPLVSGALASALTSPFWKDRILGTNDNLRVPVRCIWAATANNPILSDEMARRCIRIRLDPMVDRPWQREGFRHDELREWMADHRGDLVAAALTLIQDWVVKGMPHATVRLGSFERWAAVIGGILETAGISGFLTNLDEFYEAADMEGAIWRQFVATWWLKYQSTAVGASDLFDLAATVDGFDFGKGGDRSQKVSFGVQLTRQRDRVFDEYRIVFAGTSHRLKKWRLMPLHPPDGGISEKDTPPVSPDIAGDSEGAVYLGVSSDHIRAGEKNKNIYTAPRSPEIHLDTPPLPGTLTTQGETGGVSLKKIPHPTVAVPEPPPMPKYPTPRVVAGHKAITGYAGNVLKNRTGGNVAGPYEQDAKDVGFPWIEDEKAQDFARRWFTWDAEQVRSY